MVPPKDTLIPGACESGTLNGKKKKKTLKMWLRILRLSCGSISPKVFFKKVSRWNRVRQFSQNYTADETGETESDSVVRTTLLVLKLEEGATSQVSFPLEFLEGVQAHWHFDFNPGKLISDFWLSKL